MQIGLGIGVRRPPGYSGPPRDPSISSTKLLLSYEGADASTIFTDGSPAARGNATVTGNAQVDTAQFKFGTGSALFDGTGDVLTFADSDDWHFSTGAFTVETFIYPTSLPATALIVSQWGPNVGWGIYSGANGAVYFNVSTTGVDNLNVLASAGSVLVTDAWQHLAVDFDGTKYRLYRNGTMVASSITLRDIFNANNPLAIGASSSGSLGSIGWIDETRITKGVARYASDGGFAVPTAAFPRI